eukprot:PhM_4_TR15932/c1_g1_i6/m.170
MITCVISLSNRMTTLWWDVVTSSISRNVCPTRAFGEHIQKAHNMQLETEYEDWKASMKATEFEKRQRTLSSLMDVNEEKRGQKSCFAIGMCKLEAKGYPCA